jgi:hypothetical protein
MKIASADGAILVGDGEDDDDEAESSYQGPAA